MADTLNSFPIETKSWPDFTTHDDIQDSDLIMARRGSGTSPLTGSGLRDEIKSISKGTKFHSADIDFIVNERAIGSDGNIYKCLIANGPNTTVVDPVGDVTGTWVADGGLGVGQSWQNRTASRSRGVTYTNTTGDTIFISIVIKNDSDQINELVVDAETVSINNLPNQLAGADYSTLSTIVPDGSNYQWNKLSGADDVFSFTWLELTK